MHRSPSPGDRSRAVSRSRRTRALRVLVWRGRHVLVALGLGALAAAVVTAANPPPPAHTAVVTLAHDVAAGTSLTSADVTLRDVPVAAAPPCALTAPAAAIGASPAVTLTGGTTLCPEFLVRGAADLPAGTAAVPIRLIDAQVAALLAPGTRVDVVVPVASDIADGSMTPGGHVLTRAALVLPSPAAAPIETGLLGGMSEPEPVVLLAVRVKDAPTVAAAAVSGGLGVVLVG